MDNFDLRKYLKENKLLKEEFSNNIWDSYQMVIFDIPPSKEIAKKIIYQAFETPRTNERYWYDSAIDDEADKIVNPSQLLRPEDYPYLYINPNNNGLWSGNEHPNYKKTLSLHPSIKAINFSEINEK